MFQASEVLTAARLKAAGIRVPRDTEKDARFHPISIKKKRAYELIRIVDPLKEDFNAPARVRTWWYGIDREAQSDGKKLARCVGVIGKGGIPITAYRRVKKIADARNRNPADPDQGFDIIFTMNKKVKNPSDMWGAVRDEDTPLTKRERALLGKYQLADGTIIDFSELMSLKSKRSPKLKGYKTIKKAVLEPVNELAEAAVISAEELKETLVRCGYYDDDGNPHPELIEETPGKKKKGSWGSDDDEDDETEEEETTSKRNRRRRSRDEDDEEEDTTSRTRKKRRKREASSDGRRGGKKRRRRSSREDKTGKNRKTESNKRRRSKRGTIDLSEDIPF